MTQQPVDWDGFYQDDTPPPYSIGAPQPELATLVEQGKVRSEVLDAGCGHAALSQHLAERGYRVVGLDVSPTAIAAAAATASERGLTTASFAAVDLTDFTGYEGRFNTVMDSGCLHTMPLDQRQSYVQALHRAAAPGAGLFILAFAKGVFSEDTPGPNGFSADELHDTVSALWSVDKVRPAKLYANDTQTNDALVSSADAERDQEGRIMMPGFLLSAQKTTDQV